MEAAGEVAVGATPPVAPIRIPVTAAAARLLAALPAGIHHALLDGPWILSPAAVVFDVGATGGRRVLTHTADTVMYVGTLYGEPVAIQQTHLATADDINAWLMRVQLQCSVRAEGVLPVYGALIDIDGATGVRAFYTVTQRAAGSLATMVLAPGGALSHIGVTARLRMLWEAAAALAALHARHIVHGAVTPEKVLLSSTDDGTAAVRLVGYHTCTGTWSAGSTADDVHGWGTVAWHVLTGNPAPATVAIGPPTTAALIERGVPAVVAGTVCECLSVDPETRPTMAIVSGILAAALATGRAATTVDAVAGITTVSRPAPSEQLPALAATAREAMLQLAVRTTTHDHYAKTQIGAGSIAAAMLRAFVTDGTVVLAACVALRNLCKVCDADGAVQLHKDGVGAALVASILAYANDAEVLHVACGALTNLAVHEPVRNLLARTDGVASPLVAALRSGAADVTAACTACLTLKCLAAGADNALVLQRGGCGAAVLAALHRYADNVEVAAAACGALQNLSAVESNRCDLVRGGAGAAVVAALQQYVCTNDNVCLHCVSCDGCGVLLNLTASKDSRESLLAFGGGSAGAAVVSVLQRDVLHASVARAALCVLENLSISDHDTVATIVTALQRHAGNVNVARAACGALRHLAVSVEARKVLARDAAAVVEVLAALKRHGSDAEVAAAGCWAICNVAEDEAGGALLARDASAGAAAVAVLKDHVDNAVVAHTALRVLHNISMTETTCVPLIRDHDAADAIVAALQRHADNVEVVRAACGTLRNLGATSGTCERLARVHGIGPTLVAALTRHASDAEVVAAGCWGLRHLGAVEAGRALLTRDGIGTGAAVVVVLKKHVGDVSVSLAALSALWEISVNAEYCVPLVREHGAAAAVLTAAQRHPDNVEVVCAACGTLRNLAVPSDARTLLLRDDSIANAVVEALQQFGSDAEVARVGCWALRNLAGVNNGRTLLARDDSGSAAVVAALKQHVDNASVAEAALNALWNMTVGTTVLCERLWHTIGVMPPMLAALRRHATNDDVARAACCVLRNLGANAPSLLVVEQAVVDALVPALRAHGDDAKVAIAGCWALYRIACVEANRALVAPERSAGVVVGLLQKKMGNAAVVEAACSALWALAELRTVRTPALQAEGAGAAVLAALRRHTHGDAFTVYAITRTLCYAAKYGTLGPLASEDAAALRHIMGAHPTHRGVQLCCDDMLTLLH